MSGLIAHINLDLSHGFNMGANYLRASKNMTTFHASKECMWGVNLAYQMRAGRYAHEVLADYENGKESIWKYRWSVGYKVDLAPNIKGYAQYVKLSADPEHRNDDVTVDPSAYNVKGWLVGLKGSF